MNLATAILAPLIAALTAGAALAGNPAPQEPQKTAAAETQRTKVPRIWAKVESVDAAGGRLKVRERNGKPREFSVSPDARITKGGREERIALSELAKGQHVRLTCDGDTVKAIHMSVSHAKTPPDASPAAQASGRETAAPKPAPAKAAKR